MKRLLGTQLKLGMPVMVKLQYTDDYVPMKVSRIDPASHSVNLYSQPFGWLFGVRYDQHGIIYDNRGEKVGVFESQI